MTTQPERCPTCDRSGCPHLPYDRMNCDDYDAVGEDVTYPALEDCRAHAVDWRARALAAESRLASAPPEAEPTPTPEEVEELAEVLFAAARNRWIWNSRNAETKNEWRCAAREAWRLGARTRKP